MILIMSLNDQGSLSQLRNVLNRRNVVGGDEVKGKYRYIAYNYIAFIL
jgi:hypothetical protein